MVTPQTCWHAPTYIPESLKLLAYSWSQLPGPEAFEEKIPYCAAVVSLALASVEVPK